MRESFVFYRSFFEAITDLPDEEKGRMFSAICDYALNGNHPNFTGSEKSIFTLIKPQIDANTKKFENGKSGGIHGSKGGRPPKNNPTITPPKPHNNPTKTPNVNVNVNVNENVRSLKKPTAEDIKKWKTRKPESWEKGLYLENGFIFNNNLKPEDFPENYDPLEDCTNSLYNPLWIKGDVIRLRLNDYNAWLKMTGWSEEYFDKTLLERDDWLATEPAKAKNWFMSTSKFLQESSK